MRLADPAMGCCWSFGEVGGSVMAAAQKLAADGGGGGGAGRPGSDHFPAGLRVLVVDDEAICLRILDKMLKKCCYEVTTCSRAADALSLLRERKGSFDLVISDVHMPDMDGFKLLEHVGLLMDLPVIMMSADGSTSAVMKGIQHGACDYLIKPVRIEELRNIWQHVVRKRWNENKENDNSGSAEDIDRNNRRANDETDYCSIVSEGTDVSSWKSPKKRKDLKEDEEGELENDDSSTSKKPRVVWSVDLHQQFVNAVNQLGIDKAVPKRILELMNVPGLTRENVASHLQKFRLYLKRISIAQHQGGLPNSFCGSVDSIQKLSPGGRFDFQAIAFSGQIAPQTLAAFQSEILGKPKSGLVLPGMDATLLLAPSMQGSKSLPPECGPVTCGHHLMKCSTVINKKYSQPFSGTSGFNSWSSTHLGSMGVSGNLSGAIPTDSKLVAQMLPQQWQQSAPLETCHSINVPPSCVVVPSEVPNAFQSGSDGAISQACAYRGNPVIGYETLSQSNNMSCGTGQISEQNVGVLTGYSATSFSPALSSCSVPSEKQTAWQGQNSASYSNFSGNRLPELVPNVFEFSNFHDTKKELASDQLLGRNLGFVGNQTNIPSRYVADDIESLTTDSTNCKNCSDGLLHYNLVKQELNLDTVESTKGGLTGVHYSPSDLMGCSLTDESDNIDLSSLEENLSRTCYQT